MKRPLRRAASCAALALAAAAPLAARGAPACAFGAANAFAFGSYDTFATAPLDGSSTITYQCPPGQPIRITLDAGSAGTFASRAMRQGAEVLLYNLYLDAARTVVWGDGTGGSSIGPGVTTRAGRTTTAWVFGRIPPGQDAVPGAYGDTIRVTFEL